MEMNKNKNKQDDAAELFSHPIFNYYRSLIDIKLEDIKNKKSCNLNITK